LDKVNHRFILALVIYLILGIATRFLLKDYQYPLNPDAISYICISQKYVSGDFSNAINGTPSAEGVYQLSQTLKNDYKVTG